MDILRYMTREVVVLASQGGVRRFVIYLRRLRGWNQARLGQAVGRSQQWVSKFENGETEPRLSDALAVLKALESNVAIQPIVTQSRNGISDG